MNEGNGSRAGNTVGTCGAMAESVSSSLSGRADAEQPVEVERYLAAAGRT